MTLVVKLGSSIVAADDGELRTDVLDSVCEQVSTLEQSGERVVMVTSGAIVRGMRLMGLPRRPKAMDELQAASAVGQGDLFRAYQSRLARHGTRAAQVLLSRADITRQSHYVNARRTLERLIHWGVVPVLNENDTTASDEIGFGDNDFLAAQVAILLRARLLVLLTNTDGLYASDPRLSPGAEIVREIADVGELDAIEIGSRPSRFGSGGMGSKVAAAEMASQSKVAVAICNGTKEGTLLGAVDGSGVGTYFAPARVRRKRTSAFKLWMKYANEPTGEIWVDRGAAERLRNSGSSLLAVGVVDVKGAFEVGDVVEVVDAETGRPIGKGRTQYTGVDLRQVKGLKSSEIRALLSYAPDEVIHRDRFVLV
jgi:glutamate 5-kinase